MSFKGERSATEFDVAICKAISDKARVDPDEKAKQQLVLVAAHPLGEILKKEIAEMSFDLQGYDGVWLLAEGEDPLRLRSR